MSRITAAFAVTAISLAASAAAQTYDAAATAEWRTTREAELTGPDGWLTVAGLHFLKPGANTIGTDGGNDIVLPEGTGPDGTLDIDFNRAYNPPCAFNPYTTSPIPPAQNRLKVPVRAGERAYVPAATAMNTAAR